MENCLSLASLVQNCKCNQIVFCFVFCVFSPKSICGFFSLDVNSRCSLREKLLNMVLQIVPIGHTGKGGGCQIKTSGTYSRRVMVRQVSRSGSFLLQHSKVQVNIL